MTRAQVISDLLAALASITPAQGYPVEPAVIRRGIHLAEELNEYPGLTLFNERVESVDETDATAERTLVMHLWGAVKAAHGDYSQLDQLAAAAQRALSDPATNPHWARTQTGRLEVYEGGAGDPLGLFDLEFRVTYSSPVWQL